MSNLITHFNGIDRFYSKFNRSIFRHPESDSICAVDNGLRTEDDVRNGTIACRKLKRLASGRVASSWDRMSLPKDFFSSMAVFATPDLGYRTTAAGKWLAYVTRNPGTYHRGTATSTLQIQHSPLTLYLEGEGMLQLESEQTDTKLTDMVMNPEYVTMTAGLTAMRAGRLASFAINANVAVTPAEDNTHDIWYKTRLVGKVTEAGDINCQLKYINIISKETRNG